MSARRSIVWTSLLALLPAVVGAQSMRGVVTDSGDRPVAGVVVLLVDSVARVAARALSNERGEFRLTAPRVGTYRLRTLRIGFRPLMSDAVVLRTGSEASQRLILSGLPVALDTMRVVDRNVCRTFTDSGAATYAVWEQIRTALMAAELTAASRTIAATTVAYDRALDAGPGRSTGRVLRQQSRVSTDYVTQAWRTLAPDSLRHVGYVVTERDNSTVYYAPGLDMLLSSAFIEDHCFRLTADKNRKDVVGIAFEPTPERKRIPEIRGTLWVDRASSELRQLEFRYVNVSAEQEDHARADLAFVRMRDGTWAISRWNIVMPVVVQVTRPGHAAELRVSELRAAGGELAVARRGGDTLWTRPPMTLAGALLDSLSGAPVAGARVSVVGTGLESTSNARGRFALSGMLPGQYTLEVRTASLDSMNAVHRSPLTFTDTATSLELRVPTGQQIAETLCGAAAGAKSASGMILGRVRLRDSALASKSRGVKVVAEWNVDPADSARIHRAEVRGAPDGSFRFCAVPVNAALALRATADSATTREPSVVRIPPGVRVLRVELTLDSADQTASPVDHRIVPGRAVTLEPVTVSEKMTERELRDFEENRRLGLGHFMTRAELAKYDGMKFAAVVQQLPGVGLVNGLTGSVWITSKHAPGALCPPDRDYVQCMRSHGFYVPEAFEVRQGLKTACYALVYLDEMLMNGATEPTEPFDVNAIAPEQIEAMEFYAGAAQTPLKYSRAGSNCGVLVIWRRRSR